VSNHAVTETVSPATAHADDRASGYGLDNHGLVNLRRVFWNLTAKELVKEAAFRAEGQPTDAGALLIRNSEDAGLADGDRYLVREADSWDSVWWGRFNRPFAEDSFSMVLNRALAYLQQRELFVQDGFAGYDPSHRLAVRIITEHAWHSLCGRDLLFTPESKESVHKFIPEFTVLHVPGFEASPAVDGVQSKAFALTNLDLRMCLIGGTNHGGTIADAVIQFLNYLLPDQQVLPLRGAVCTDNEAGPSLLVGHAGSGCTTVAGHGGTSVVGTTAIGWSGKGLYGLFHGCHCKANEICTSSGHALPESLAGTGSVLENVPYDQASGEFGVTREDSRITCPLKSFENAGSESTVPHPSDVFLLVCDVYGVLPAIAKLTPEQTAYYYLSGYSAEVSGLETDPGKQPETTFNPCYGASQTVLHPARYASMLGNKVARYGANCWLVNTGWTGGPYGVGHRIQADHVYRLVDAARKGNLDVSTGRVDPVFGFQIPGQCDGVPCEVLDPSEAASDESAYKERSAQLAGLFVENFRRFADCVDERIAEAGPKLSGLRAWAMNR
jgi:phosphoenolpyruvate carboxykinase (ATP)